MTTRVRHAAVGVTWQGVGAVEGAVDVEGVVDVGLVEDVEAVVGAVVVADKMDEYISTLQIHQQNILANFTSV